MERLKTTPFNVFTYFSGGLFSDGHGRQILEKYMYSIKWPLDMPTYLGILYRFKTFKHEDIPRKGTFESIDLPPPPKREKQKTKLSKGETR